MYELKGDIDIHSMSVYVCIRERELMYELKGEIDR